MQHSPVMLLVLLACAGTADKPGDRPERPDETGDSFAPDTHDTADSGTPDSEDSDSVETSESTDTADSGETGDSADTGDTGDTGEYAPFVESDVPGWDDYACIEDSPGRAISFTFPDVFEVQGVFLAGQPAAGPHLLTVKLRDCETFSCTTTLDLAEPYAAAELDGTWGDAGLPRALGVWGPDDTAPRYVTGDGESPFGRWTDTRWWPASAVTVCFERMRPDEVRGVIRAAAPLWSLYRNVILLFPFSIQLDDHAGFDTTLPDTADPPFGYHTAHFEYDIPYDEAWPWEEITDAKVRRDLYDRFTPYNAP